jgi:hypothetical protein
VKRPSFQFYPGDWLQDTALRASSLAARGLWADMLCIMHQGRPYGHLTLPATGEDGHKEVLRPILPPVLARMVGAGADDLQCLLDELESAGVFSRTSDGVIFSRRMVHDEKVREARASGGIQSLNHPNVPRPKGRETDIFNESSRTSSVTSFGGSPSSSSSSSSKNPLSEQQTYSDAENPPTQKKNAKQPSQNACRLAGLMRSEILRNKSDYRITSAEQRKWEVTAQRMLDIDKRKPEQIEFLIRWVQQDEFWMTNILSMDTLRKKFDQLQLKAAAKTPKSASPTALPATYVPGSVKVRREIQERTAGGLQ